MNKAGDLMKNEQNLRELALVYTVGVPWGCPQNSSTTVTVRGSFYKSYKIAPRLMFRNDVTMPSSK